MQLQKAFCLFICLLIAVLSEAQKLTAVERNIIKNVDKNLPQTMALLEQLVNINSGTLNVAGVRKTGSLLGKEFEKIGFTNEWISLPGVLKRAGHLAVQRKGSKGKKLLLLGHLDTVFEPGMPPNPYKKLNDSTATGQGVVDMKGGNVIILAALKALYEAGLLKNTSVTAYFTGDEEKTGTPSSVSRADLIERAKQHDVALGFEASQSLEIVATGRRGSSGWQLNVSGIQAHSAGMFNNNYGAIYEAGRILNSFREQLSNEQYLTLSPGIIAGGSNVLYDSTTIRADVQGKTNIIAPRVVAQGDLRFLTEEQKEVAREKMRMITSTNNLAGTSAMISFVDGIPGMEPTVGNNKLVELLNKITIDMGIGETKAGDPGSRGAGDISYIAKYIDCLDGLGPMGSGAHAPGETINLQKLPLLIHRAAIFIYRLTR